MKFKLRLIRARPNFYIVRDNRNVSLGIVNCSLYTRCTARKDDYHYKEMDMLAFSTVEFNYMDTLPKASFVPDRQNQSIQEIFLNKVPVRRIVIAMNTNSAFTGSHNENLFWDQKIVLRQFRIFRGGNSIVNFDASDKCCLPVTTMKAMNFQDDITSIPIDNFQDHYVLVFDLNSIQDDTEKIPLARTSCRTTEAGDKLYFPTKTRPSTHGSGRTNVFSSS